MLLHLKKNIAKNFESFAYFYKYLRYRILFFIVFSLGVGILDGLGLSMFLPLLQMVGNGEIDSSGLGKLSVLIDGLENMEISFTLAGVLGMMTVFFLLKGVAVFFQSYYVVIVQQYFIRKIREQDIHALNNVSFRYFMKADIGQIQNTLTGETTKVAMAFNSYFLAFQQGVLVLVYMSFAYFVDAQFAVLVSVGGLLTNVIFRTIYKQTKGYSIELTKKTNRLQGLIIQHINNYKYLKATGWLNRYGKKLIEQVHELHRTGKKIGLLSSMMKGAREPLLIIIVSGVILIQVQVLSSPLGPILVSLLFFYRALTAVMATQTAWNYFLSNSGSIINIKSFEHLLAENKQENILIGDLKFQHQIQLQNVSVVFDKTVALDSINLTIQKNETIAFVGESGSGKTTLINVLSGLIDITNGRIIVDGEEVPSLHNVGYQQNIGYITQESVIFNDTVFNNVSFWANKNEQTLNRFHQALQKAALFDFVNTMELKEDTLLGNNGINLSGGQRQRISIARELYKDVEILIMDEATSALDSETELAIKESIDQLKGEYTILTIAHRLSTVKKADQLVFMKKGQIVKVGSFEELGDSIPEFKRMIELQEI